jgi:hypothetical protein
MSVPQNSWEETGPAEDPKARVHTHIRINGLDMHLEAIEVKERVRRGFLCQMPKDGEYEYLFDYLVEFAGSVPSETVRIGRRQYCLFATPFCT